MRPWSNCVPCGKLTFWQSVQCFTFEKKLYFCFQTINEKLVYQRFKKS